VGPSLVPLRLQAWTWCANVFCILSLALRQREQEFIDTYEILEDLMAEIQRKREEEQKARDDARAVHDKQSRPAKEAAKEKSKTTQSALSATSGFDEDEHSQPADGSHAESHDGAKKAETKQEAVVEKKLPCKTVVPRSHKYVSL